MAIAVEFYTFSKKRNSTAFPTTGAITFNMELKEPTSALNPTLWVAARDLPVPGAAPTIYNYAHVAAFQRYYFVSDWVYNAGVWEVSLTVDPLGSWKTGIGSISTYVERSSYTYDGTVMDTLYPAKTNFTITNVSGFSSPWSNVAPSGGAYILGCINYQSSNQVGAISYYACTQAQLSNVLNFLFGNSIYNSSNITEMGQGLYESFFNPFQYIVSCIWLPFPASSFGDTQTDIKIGYWSSGIQAYMVTSLGRRTYVSCTIPDHPQAAARGVYLNQAPYTRMTLYIPPFGNIPVDNRGLALGKYLYCPVVVDHITGEATIRVNITPDGTGGTTLSEFNYLTERTSMLGVPIQLAQVMNEYSKNPTSLLSDVLAEGILSVIGTTVGSSINCSTPKVTTSGANGSFINFMLYPGLVVEHALLVDENNSCLGRPLMQTKTISSIPGYIKAIDPPISLPITETETQMIRQYMTDGFYYE